MKIALDTIRGLTRPYLTYLYGTLGAVMACYGLVKYATPEIWQLVIGSFVTSLGYIIGHYFQSRNQPRVG